MPLQKSIRLPARAVPWAAAASLVCACAAALLFLPMRSAPPGGVVVTIPRGSNLSRIASILAERRLVAGSAAFKTSVRVLGGSHTLKAGVYRFEGRLSHHRVTAMLRGGLTYRLPVTFPEGLRAEHAAAIARRELGVDSAAFMARVHDPLFCAGVGVEAASLEGYLFPDTYAVEPGTDPEPLLRSMAARFHAVFSDSLLGRARSMGLSVHEAVTLASIVEGEARLASERPVIAALYHNRLRRGMALQACPTVQYLLSGRPRRLLNRDLAIPSPYNTYLHPGLPPGPVNSPGAASLRAVLYPAPVSWLFLVANGDGSHTFSSNLAEHNRAKQRLQFLRRRTAAASR